MQPVGEPVDATPAALPQRAALVGRYVEVIALDAAAHGDDLYAAATSAGSDGLWTYLSFGPWPRRDAFDAWLNALQASTDPFAFVLRETASGRAQGMASYMRIEPQHRVIEIGSIWYSPSLQRTRAATEAMYLLARHAFETLGYRRYEWKCNSLNEPSRRAALRLGFTYEGLFRQHMISRGRNRDTTWFSMLDAEWPARKQAFERWLAPDNFDADGRQRRSLIAFRNASTNG
jgi:RimJ/RimL family protein N-acetyltransferase